MAKPAYAMVVTPHPDDAEYGIAGTVARWVKEGKDVVYVVCTNGDKGTSDINMRPEVLAKIREKEQLDAANVLGVRDVIFLRHPDQGLEDTYEFRKQLVRLIRMYRPDIVATTDPYLRYMWHRDHRIAGQVVLDAVFPFARDFLAYPDLMLDGLQPHKVKEVLLWSMLLFWDSQEINYRSDISDTLDLKIAALRCHESQVGHMPFPDLENLLRQQHEAMAQGESFKLAEAFHRVELFG
jgi:LmbE family N-acetylglucosaminyl deacetylase